MWAEKPRQPRQMLLTIVLEWQRPKYLCHRPSNVLLAQELQSGECQHLYLWS
jgi:hypothetical protein